MGARRSSTATTVVAHARLPHRGHRRARDVVFPAESYAEKEGTVTHPDGRLQRLRRAIGRPGETRAEWQVLAELSRRLGADLGVLTGAMVTQQLFDAVPFYAGLTLDEIGGRGVRWQEREQAAARPAGDRPAPFELEAPPGRRAGQRRACALGTFRSIWAAPEVEASPALKFLAPAPARRARRPATRSASGIAHGRARRRRPGRRAASTAPRTCARPRSRAPCPRDRDRRRTAPASWTARSSRCAAHDPERCRHRSPIVGYAEPWWIQIIKALVIFAVGLQLVPVVLIAERKLLGRFQNRYGPNRVGPFGALQPLADIVKLLTKEQFRPRTSIGLLFTLAPMISILTAVAAFAIIPFGDTSGHLRHAGRALRHRRHRSARCTCSRSARSPSTGSCSAAGRRARSTRSSARCAAPRS